MSLHPINLALRFILELCAGFAVAYWGWTRGEGILRFGLAITLPLILATLWGVLAVPNDPSRSGQAPLPVPGLARLLLELAIFALAVGALFAARQPRLGWVMGVVVVIHYLTSYDRIAWLLKQ